MSHRGLTRFEGICLCFNLIMGAGFLALPRALVDAGVLVGLGLMLTIPSVLIVTALFESEIILRVTAAKWLEGALPKSSDANTSNRRPSDVETFMKPHDKRSYSAVDTTETRPTTLDAALLPLSGQRTLEMTEVCDLLVGPKAKVAYCVMLASYQVISLWGYASVFGQAMAGLLSLPGLGPSCDIYANSAGDTDECASLYRGWVAVFATLAIPLSILDPKEQATFQVFMTAARLMVLSAMVASVAAAALGNEMAADISSDNGVSISAPSSSALPSTSAAYWFGSAAAEERDAAGDAPLGPHSISGLYSAFSVMVSRKVAQSRLCWDHLRLDAFTHCSQQVFAQQMNMRIGMLCSGVHDKIDVKACTLAGMVGSALAFATFSFVVGVYFGEAVRSKTCILLLFSLILHLFNLGRRLLQRELAAFPLGTFAHYPRCISCFRRLFCVSVERSPDDKQCHGGGLPAAAILSCCGDNIYELFGWNCARPCARKSKNPRGLEASGRSSPYCYCLEVVRPMPA